MRLDFSEASVLVVGDVMLDTWFRGRVGRISPEAPVPIVAIDGEQQSLGGAANVAANIAGLGARSTLAAIVGDDAAADRLRRLLDAGSIESALLTTDRPTTTKTRVVGDRQQLVRLDFERAGPLEPAVEAALLASVEPHLDRADAVIVSDYGKGVCTTRVCRHVIDRARARGIPVLVDPKTVDWSRYRGASLVTPNFREFCEVVGASIDDEDAAIEEVAPTVAARFDLGGLLVTRSARGMTLSRAGTHTHIHSEALDVFDVTGAGDTVIATLGTAMASGASARDAAVLANSAAGVVVARAGSVPITLQALREATSQRNIDDKIVGRQRLLGRLALDRDLGKRIVFTNGCFDLLHRGHVTYLREARRLGDRLVVGLNTDASVRRLKGPSRPLVPEGDRALMLSAMTFVDYVVLFDEDTPRDLIADVSPDVLVKGGDYRPQDVVGREFARELVLIDFVDGYSSTDLIGRIRGDSKE